MVQLETPRPVRRGLGGAVLRGEVLAEPPEGVGHAAGGEDGGQVEVEGDALLRVAAFLFLGWVLVASLIDASSASCAPLLPPLLSVDLRPPLPGYDERPAGLGEVASQCCSKRGQRDARCTGCSAG